MRQVSRRSRWKTTQELSSDWFSQPEDRKAEDAEKAGDEDSSELAKTDDPEDAKEIP